VTLTGGAVDNSVVGFDVSVTGTYGTLYVNSETGAYHYVLDHDLADSLPEGESHDENFSYVVDDGHGGTNGSTLKVTVTGTNDAAVITDAAVPVADFAVKEDTDSSAGGTLLVSDVDTGESAFDAAFTGGTGAPRPRHLHLRCDDRRLDLYAGRYRHSRAGAG